MTTEGNLEQGQSDTPEAVGTAAASPNDDPEKEADRQEHQIEEIRDHLGNLVTELERRRHSVSPVRLALRFPLASLLGGLAVTGVVAGAIAWQVHQSRKRSSWRSRGGELALALRRAVKAPDQVAKPQPNLPLKVATAIAVAAAGTITRRMLARAFADRDRA